MAGKLDSFDLWKCMPSSMRVSGQNAEDLPKALIIGEGGSVSVEDKKVSKKDKLARLIAYLLNPLAFINAGMWFVAMTQYWYEDPGLAQAMLQFGWRIVKCDNKFYWHDCLQMFVDVAPKLIRSGMLQQHAELFGGADLADACMLFAQRTDMHPSSTPVARGAVNTPSAAQVTRSARLATYCQDWNRNAGVAALQNRLCRYEHLCTVCEGPHPRVECPAAAFRQISVAGAGNAQAQL